MTTQDFKDLMHLVQKAQTAAHQSQHPAAKAAHRRLAQRNTRLFNLAVRTQARKNQGLTNEICY